MMLLKRFYPRRQHISTAAEMLPEPSLSFSPTEITPQKPWPQAGYGARAKLPDKRHPRATEEERLQLPQLCILSLDHRALFVL